LRTLPFPIFGLHQFVQIVMVAFIQVGNQDTNCTLLEYMQHRRASVLFVQKYQAGGE
jgi:hypothetical protein